MTAGRPDPTAPRLREAARVLLLDQQDRVLLFRWEVPTDMDAEQAAGRPRSVWITPGGGLDPGESHEDAALRELWEETGLKGISLGPCIWERSHIFRFRDIYLEQRERFFVVRAPEMVLDAANWTKDEVEWIREHRWWTAAEIAAASDQRFAPRALGELLADCLANGFPATRVTIDV